MFLKEDVNIIESASCENCIGNAEFENIKPLER